MPTQAEVAELIGYIRATKHKVTKTGNSKHYKVLRPNGAVVVDANGPLIISSSPSEHRWREMTVKRLMAVDPPVLTKDPYKPTQSNPQEKNGGEPAKKKGSTKFGTPEMEAKKVAAIQAKSKRLQSRTAQLRARFEPVVVKLGGWRSSWRSTSGITAAELGEVIYTWAKNRGREELPKVLTRGGYVTAESLRAPAQTFKTPGGTLGEKWLPLFELFVDELERDAGTPPRPEKAAEKYLEILRTEVKKISPGPTTPRPLPPPEAATHPVEAHERHEPKTMAPVGSPQVAPTPTDDGSQDVPDVVRIGPRYEPDTYIDAPQLALNALYEMAARSHPADHEARERHMALARQIAELELNQKKGGTV